MTTKEKLYQSFSAVTESYDGFVAIAELYIGELTENLNKNEKRIVEILENKGFIEVRDDGRVVNRFIK